MKLAAQEWSTLSRLLDEALDLDADAQQAWLDALDDSYAALKPTIRNLLAQQADADSDAIFQALPGFSRKTVEQASARASNFIPGDSIGPYRLLRELGRGGMGAVWLADRPDGLLKREVALKLPHPRAYDDQLAARFARERDILSGLAHPNIARLYDAGVAASGQPFLAIEYVDGMPLTEYCDAKRLTIQQRLELFAQILHAIQYAHMRHVVHRDLKPSNILVTDEGTVQLLDFGIAKLIDDDSASDTGLTQLGGVALTPDYASPEQIAQQPITTAADIYSLGVILYELLAGARPYRLKHNTRGELEEAILNTDPLPPSRAIKAGACSRFGADSPRKLVSALEGDLDTIVLKALNKNPDGRYATAALFSQDIRSHLRGEPVLARPPSRWYRSKKFLLRNRLGVASGAWTAVALVAILSVVGLFTIPGRDGAPGSQAAGMRSVPTMSVAILPFASSHGDPEVAQFADALTRGLSTRLSRAGGAKGRAHVVSAHANASSDAGASDVRALGRSLNVRYVLEGDVLRGDGTDTVNLRLFDTSAGAQVWSEREAMRESDVAANSSARLENVSRRIHAALLAAETRRALALPPQNLAPQEIVLRAWALWDKDQSIAGTRAALKLVDDALQRDPNLMSALLARFALTDVENDVDPNPDHDRLAREMDEFSGRAVRLDPTDPTSWVNRATALFYLARWDAALEASEMAIKLDPLDASLLVDRAWKMTMMGRPGEALALLDRALAMDPVNIGPAMHSACAAHLVAGHAEQAVAACEKATGLGDEWIIQMLLAVAYANSGNLVKAAAERTEVLRTNPDFTIAKMRARRYSDHPDYLKIAEENVYPGLRKAGFPEQ